MTRLLTRAKGPRTGAVSGNRVLLLFVGMYPVNNRAVRRHVLNKAILG